jgi:hypothetical protein
LQEKANGGAHCCCAGVSVIRQKRQAAEQQTKNIIQDMGLLEEGQWWRTLLLCRCICDKAGEAGSGAANENIIQDMRAVRK